MAATMSEERVKLVGASAFTIEADHHNNSDLLLQSIPGCRLRTAILSSRTTIDPKTGDQRTSRGLGDLPQIPGMRLAVNPEKLSYEITDPLYTDEDACERIRVAINRINPDRITGRLRGVEPKKGSLDVHRMKTLCRELLWLINAGDAKVIRGAAPNMDDVDALPGKYLLNPGSQVPNTQPRYEEDMEKWVERLAAGGG